MFKSRESRFKLSRFIGRHLWIPFLGLFLISCSQSNPSESPAVVVDKEVIAEPVPAKPDIIEPLFSVQGHRGARDIYPENTLPGFDYALKVGADQIEFDMQFTADNDIVIYHDAYLSADRCLTNKGKKIPDKTIFIRGMTLEQVRQFDCGSLQSKGKPRYTIPGEKIPTLDQLVELVLTSKHLNADQVIFKFDIKYEAKTPQFFPKPSEIARMVIDKVYYYGIQKRSIFSAFDPQILKELHKIDPSLKLAFLVGLDVNQKNLELAKSLHVDTFSPHYLGLYLKGINKWTKKFHEAGIRVVPYTVDKESSWKKLIKGNVDGIITDDPEGLRAYYGEYLANRESSSEL